MTDRFEPPSKTELAEERTDWAESRTDWAEDRTVLANERTFAGWLRTGMAAVALAVGLRAVFREAEPAWLPKAAATVFLLAALIIFWTARRNAGKAHARLTVHNAEVQKSRTFTLLAAIFTIGAVATGIVLWSL